MCTLFFYGNNDEDTVAIFQVSDEDGIEETDRGRKGRASRALGKRTGLFGVACAILVVKSTRFGCRAPPRLYLPSRSDPMMMMTTGRLDVDRLHKSERGICISGRRMLFVEK